MQEFFLAECKAVWGEGSVSVAYIMQSFHKFIVSLSCLILPPLPPPMWAVPCKLLVETLLVCLAYF